MTIWKTSTVVAIAMLCVASLQESPRILVNGRVVAEGLRLGGTTYAPVRAVAEGLGGSVKSVGGDVHILKGTTSFDNRTLLWANGFEEEPRLRGVKLGEMDVKSIRVDITGGDRWAPSSEDIFRAIEPTYDAIGLRWQAFDGPRFAVLSVRVFGFVNETGLVCTIKLMLIETMVSAHGKTVTVVPYTASQLMHFGQPNKEKVYQTIKDMLIDLKTDWKTDNP